MESRPKILVIVGPTTSGKSALAVRVAKQFGGEVISADSRQVYRGLDIGSGKITVEEMRGVPHHLLDIADPREQFSVAEYQKLAGKKVDEILARKKLPIICGGTGLYIRALVDNLVLPPAPPNPALRAELAFLTTEQLFTRLQKLDPARAATIDRHNPRRLVRAIEIALAPGSVPKLKDTECPLKYNFEQIGLNPPPVILRQNIRARLLARLDQGLIEEVQNLQDAGLSWQRLDDLGLEYRYVSRWLQLGAAGAREIATLLTELELAIWRYAKRQLTWFKRDPRIVWFERGDEAVAALQEKV